jgi:hypothetical protein
MTHREIKFQLGLLFFIFFIFHDPDQTSKTLEMSEMNIFRIMSDCKSEPFFKSVKKEFILRRNTTTDWLESKMVRIN